MPGEKFVEHKPRSEDIRGRARVGRLPPRFRGCVICVDLLDDICSNCKAAVRPCSSVVETGKPDVSVTPEEYRARRQVTMDHLMRVTERERFKQLLGNLQLLIKGERQCGLVDV